MNTTIAYLVAVLRIVLIGCGSLVTLEIARPGGDYNSQAAYTIVGICTTVLTVLLGIIKSIGNGQALEEVKQDTKEVKHTAKRAVEQAEAASQLAAQVSRPIQAEVVIHSDKSGGKP